jgi:hypothetical protein
MKKQSTRKLADTSWLAQVLADRMEVEFSKNGQSGRWNALNVLHTVINMADNGSAEYRNDNGKRQVIITNPSYNLQCGLLGLAARYGSNLVYVLATHDLNSAEITDLSELVYQMSS